MMNLRIQKRAAAFEAVALLYHVCPLESKGEYIKKSGQFESIQKHTVSIMMKMKLKGDTPMNIDMTNLYRSRGMIPNRYWYQLNGQSAQANWLEQREAIYSRIQEQEEEVVPQIIFTSEVKIR